MVWKTLEAQQRTNAQLNSHMAPAGNRTKVTLVRGECFTHKPTVPHLCCALIFLPCTKKLIFERIAKTLDYPTAQIAPNFTIS